MWYTLHYWAFNTLSYELLTVYNGNFDSKKWFLLITFCLTKFLPWNFFQLTKYTIHTADDEFEFCYEREGEGERERERVVSSYKHVEYQSVKLQVDLHVDPTRASLALSACCYPPLVCSLTVESNIEQFRLTIWWVLMVIHLSTAIHTASNTWCRMSKFLKLKSFHNTKFRVINFRSPQPLRNFLQSENSHITVLAGSTSDPLWGS